jgi:hypothetical protein
MWNYFVLVYENRKMRFVETILRMSKWRKEENDGGGKFN